MLQKRVQIRCYLLVDEGSVGAHWVATNPKLAVVRLHGRNVETWDIKGATAASERFNYV